MIRSILSLLVLVQPVGASDTTPQTSSVNETLRQELLTLEEADQEVRREFIRAGVDTPSAALVAKIEAVDAANTRRIKQIIAEFGWPGRSLVGADGAQAAFLLVQHADRDLQFQKTALPLIQRAFASGEVPGEAVAMLTDRVLVAEGKPQLYGTQTTIENGTVRVEPVADEAGLDERRVLMGLPPMKEYLRMLGEMYQLPVAVK